MEYQVETETNEKGEIIRATIVKKRVPKAGKTSEKTTNQSTQ